jgi:hypothetical protein
VAPESCRRPSSPLPPALDGKEARARRSGWPLQRACSRTTSPGDDGPAAGSHPAGSASGFAAVFGTPVSGALFGNRGSYLGKIEYRCFSRVLMAGLVAHSRQRRQRAVPAPARRRPHLGPRAWSCSPSSSGPPSGCGAPLHRDQCAQPKHTCAVGRPQSLHCRPAGGLCARCCDYSGRGDRVCGSGHRRHLSPPWPGPHPCSASASSLKILTTP